MLHLYHYYWGFLVVGYFLSSPVLCLLLLLFSSFRIRCRFFFTITIVTMISLWASWQYANCKVWIAVAMCCLTFAPLCKLYLKANSLSFTQLFFPVDEVNMCNCFCQLIDSISDLMSCSTRCICFIQESELVAKGYV